MTSPRYIFAFLLAAALLFAQQGAAVHTLHHVVAEQAQSQNKQLPHAPDCEQCTAYAQLASALGSSVSTFDFGLPLHEVHAQNVLAFISQHALPASARGPPALPSLS